MFENRISKLIHDVTKEVGVSVDDIFEKKRHRPVPMARHILCYFLSVHEKKTNEEAALILGGLNQSAIFYGEKKMNDALKNNNPQWVRKVVNKIEQKFYGESA